MQTVAAALPFGVVVCPAANVVGADRLSLGATL
jgi:hypothetical protein